MSKFAKASSRLAALLSGEKITVRHGQYDTASFDLETRILRLPHYNDKVDEHAYAMLVAHEIAHCLWTPLEGWHNATVDLKIDRHLVNVVEDVRIEKLVQRKYPGLYSSFILGRDCLVHDCGFFRGIDQSNIAHRSFIDRINVDWKAGHIYDVPFNDEEQEIYDVVKAAETWQDTLNACNMILAYEAQQQKFEFCNIDLSEIIRRINELQEELKEDLQETYAFGSDEDEDEDEDDFDFDGYENEDEAEVEESSKSDSGKIERTLQTDKMSGQEEYDDEEQESLREFLDQYEVSTDIAYRNAESDLYEVGVRTVRVRSDINPIHNGLDAYVAYRARPEESVDHLAYHRDGKAYDEWVKENNGVIAKMVSEFNLRKNAINKARATNHRTGHLDTRKLYNARFSEKLFKNIERLPKQQNHGATFWVDTSGSMGGPSIGGVTFQAMIMAEFCHRMKIPFSVVSWTSGRIADLPHPAIPESENTSPYVRYDSVILVRILDSMQTLEDYRTSMNILATYIKNGAGYSWPYHNLGGTPTATAKAGMLHEIKRIKKRYGVQRMHSMFLTDGTGDSDAGVYDPDRAGVPGWQRQKNVNRTEVFFDDEMLAAIDFSSDRWYSDERALDEAISDECDTYIGYYVGQGVGFFDEAPNHHLTYSAFFNIPIKTCSQMVKQNMSREVDSEHGFDRHARTQIRKANALQANLRQLCGTLITKFV